MLEKHENPHICTIILATSDRGLCGGFNASLITAAVNTAKAKQAEGYDVQFLCVGKKGRDAIRKFGYPILAEYVDVMGALDFTVASSLGKEVVSGYTSKAMDEVILICGQFVSVAKQIPTVQTILPVAPLTGESENLAANGTEYVYEPQVTTLLAEILPRFVNVQIYRGLLDTSASEHAARMSAMDNATRNCDEMSRALTLLYNKTRQTSITNELIDIVGGAEALK